MSLAVCPTCDERFSSDRAFDVHLERSRDSEGEFVYRCRTPKELEERGMRKDARGIWRRSSPGWDSFRRTGAALSRTVLQTAIDQRRTQRRPPEGGTSE